MHPFCEDNFRNFPLNNGLATRVLNPLLSNLWLKSLTRYRFDEVEELAKPETSIARLVCILFPGLDKSVPPLHIAHGSALFVSGSKAGCGAHLTRFKELPEASSGIGTRMGVMILAEVGDFPASTPRIKYSPASVLPPLPTNPGSLQTAMPIWRSAEPYLRFALYNDAKYDCDWDPTFSDHPARKRAEGKHYTGACFVMLF